MAFCPNCGTPNTDQAEKCVSCSFELAPKQKAKFKGTIMMQGVQLPGTPAKPGAQEAPAAPPAAAAPPAPAPAPATKSAAPSGKNVGFEKTMMGGPGLGLGGLPPAGTFGTPGAGPGDLARAATVEGSRASFDAKPPVAAFTPSPAEVATTQAGTQAGDAPPAAQQFGGGTPAAGFGNASSFGGGAAGGFGNTGGFAGGSGANTGGFGNSGGYGNTGGFGNTGGYGSAPPMPKTNTGKVIAIGCAVAFTLACVIGGLLYSMLKEKLSGVTGGGAKESAALEWRGSVSTALIQIAALCQSDCQAAAVYFHPDVQNALLNEAKQLSAVRATKLADPTTSQAAMLDTTEDAAIATKLQLDPMQCVRVVAGSAKVIGCSVPTPGGQPNLRIVHLEGLGSL